MDLSALKGNDILITLLVVWLVCEGIKTLGSAIETLKKWKKPRNDQDASVEGKLKDCSDKLANDKRTLDRHDLEIADLKDGQRKTCHGIQALLDHELHNGNSNDMQEASDEITKWLRERR